MAENENKVEEEVLENEEDEVLENEEGGQQTTEGNKVSGKSAGSGKNTKKDRTFTQSQVSRIMTREKNQGRAAVYKELGIDPNDTRMVSMFRAFVESQKTEEQKNAEKDAEAAKKQQEAEHRVMMAEAKAEAMMLGIKSQYVEDAVALAMSKMSDDTDLKTVLNELKDKYKFWTEDEEEEEDRDGGKKNDKTGKKGTGSTVKETTKKNGKEQTGGFGAKLAAQRNAARGKKSYWGNS